jgi:hypothetical protein
LSTYSWAAAYYSLGTIERLNVVARDSRHHGNWKSYDEIGRNGADLGGQAEVGLGQWSRYPNIALSIPPLVEDKLPLAPSQSGWQDG